MVIISKKYIGKDKIMSIGKWAKNIFIYSPPAESRAFDLNSNDLNIKFDIRKRISRQAPPINKDISINYNYIKKKFNYPENNDVVMRKFTLKNRRNCFIVFYDGMSDTRSVDQDIIKPMLELPLLASDADLNYENIIYHYVSHSQAEACESFDNIIEEINFGSCGLFVDGINKGFIMDVRSWGHRGIDRPETEQSIYGPQEAFSEMLRNNSALVRKILKTEKLICEAVKIGNISKTRGVLMYISDLTNENLVKEVRSRLNGISIDYCIAIEEVAMLIEENNFFITSRILSTERPDRVAKALSEGRAALILNGSPHALIFPTNAFELIHAASDSYLRVPYANMTRIIRLTAIGLSVLLPALYLAITLFHQEMIPTFLVYSISASRESVPFPSIAELLLMDLSFEMIREAGIRMPNPIGSTLGIVGGLILGQAAVSAKIVSPIMIIIIALTGLGSFATPDYSLSWSYRILRIIFIILAGICGFYGVAVGIFIYSVLLASQKSFGVPFLSPLSKEHKSGTETAIAATPIWKQENRPDFLRTKKEKQEPKISMKWRFKRKK